MFNSHYKTDYFSPMLRCCFMTFKINKLKIIIKWIFNYLLYWAFLYHCDQTPKEQLDRGMIILAHGFHGPVHCGSTSYTHTEHHAVERCERGNHFRVGRKQKGSEGDCKHMQSSKSFFRWTDFFSWTSSPIISRTTLLN